MLHKNLKFVPILSIIYLAILLRGYVLNALFPLYFGQDPVFISDLLGVGIIMPIWLIWLAAAGNIILIYLTGKIIFNNKIGLFAAFLYAISPWTIYSDVGSSSYVVLLFGILLFILGLLILKDKNIPGCVLSLAGIVVLLTVSFWGLVILPIFIISVWRGKLLSLSRLRLLLISVACFYLFILLLMIRNNEGSRNIITHQVSLFTSSNLVSIVNARQGELSGVSYSKLGRLVDNRYSYFFQYIIFTLTQHFSPLLYFLPGSGITGRLFSPPLFLGLLIPLLFGYKTLVLFFRKYRWLLFTPLVLTVPSLLSQKSPDMIRLIIFSPVIFLLVSAGLFDNLLPGRGRAFQICKVIFFILIIIQMLVFITDVAIREPLRLLG